MKKRFTRRDFLKETGRAVVLASAGGCAFLIKGCSSKKDFDLIIKDGFIIDGRGNSGFKADIGISGNMINTIGKISISRGKTIIDASDLVVTPGFIDVHDHTDIELLVNPKAESAVRQGITTLISGNCGSSAFPVAEEVFEERRASLKEEYDIDLNWRDMKGFFSRLEEKGMAVHYASLVGHGDIRGASMGFNDRPPKPEEMEKMKTMLVRHIENGALGLSTGLEYAPGSYAQKDEIVELCKIVARYGGVYATHMRDEGDMLLESLDESIDTTRKSGVSLQISHFKAAYPRNWHKIDAALARIEEAKKDGLDIFCDRYPYIAASTGLSFYFPLWARQGKVEEFLARLKDPFLDGRLREHLAEQEKKLGSWDKVVISSVITEKNQVVIGKNILEASAEAGKEPYVFMRDLLIEEKDRVGMVIFMMTEDNLKRILAHPLVGVGTDGSAKAPYGLLGKGQPHPRSYGTFPRVLGKYIREEKILSLEEMVMKVTSRPAGKFGLTGRGVIEGGFAADLVLFDPDRVIDQAIWTDPHRYPLGIEYVIVNGKVVVERGEHSGALPGKVLKKA